MRTLFVVPLMFMRDDLSKITPELPEDYDSKSGEFWNYVAEKLRTQTKVQRIFFDSLITASAAANFVKKESSRAYDIIQEFSGAELMITEDKDLVAESSSWAKMLESGDVSSATQDLLADTMTDRDRFVAKTVSDSLKDGETGILFLSPGRRAGDYLLSDIRTIRVQPFDPMDYLNSWLVTLRLREKKQSQS